MRSLLSFLLLSIPPLLQLTLAQDGSITGPTSSAAAANYTCDPTKCKLPNCACASTEPPGGLTPAETPMFVVFTADDAIQSYTIDALKGFLWQRKNPNGCVPKMTYYNSLTYSNYTLTTDWFVAGNEIADHTMTHAELPGLDEINGNLIALNALGGIPFSSVIGFRAPYLNYSAQTLTYLHQSGFSYDSSATASLPVDMNGTDAFWPYTLDNGLANDCLSFADICGGKPSLPGMWEFPMYAVFDENGVNGPHLMDPWLDGNTSAVLSWMKNTFTAHYNGNRQPFGIYTHPIHLATGYPGLTDPVDMINMLNEFLDWLQLQPNVWIISNEQLLAWVRDPVSIANLDSFDALKCSTPAVTAKICDGIPENEAGLLSRCPFPDFPFFTCYGCPVTEPTPDTPNPEQAPDANGKFRSRLPGNCSTPFWDPIAATCLCTGSNCSFTDQSRPIGPNGLNLTGGGTGQPNATSTQTATWVPFVGAAFPSFKLSTELVAAVGVATLGALGGSLMIGTW